VVIEHIIYPLPTKSTISNFKLAANRHVSACLPPLFSMHTPQNTHPEGELHPKLRTVKMHTHTVRRMDQHKSVNNRNAFIVVQDRAMLESDPSGSMGFAKQMRIVKWLSVFVFICFGK
jgi:hypothetical protein